MSNSTQTTRRVRREDSEWSKLVQQATVGQDVLELVSSAMYVDPLAIYREYVQNAADAADEVHTQNALRRLKPTRIEFELDRVKRSARITDDATGIPANQFVPRLVSFGASEKRGTRQRGFRGVGRLAGLGFCRELLFRSRSAGESVVSEMKWDCVKLKKALRETRYSLDKILREIVSVRTLEVEPMPQQFFQVEMRGIVRNRDDRLLNAAAVSAYLSEVCPIAFAGDFPFKSDVELLLQGHIPSTDLDIIVNEGPALRRSHGSNIPIAKDKNDNYKDFQAIRIKGLDGGIAAVGWVAHHSYFGSLPKDAGIKGLRLRMGDMQVGDDRILEGLFREQRFNSWAIGEIHVVDPRVLPNGRRDNFEESPHFDNILNHLGLVTRDIAQRCRLSSQRRKWQREFELHHASANNHLDIAEQRAIGPRSAAAHIEATRADLKSLEKIALKEAFSDQTSELNAQIKRIDHRLKSSTDNSKLLGPFAHLKSHERRAFEQCFELLYECAANRIAATALIDRVLAKLAKTRANVASKRQLSRRRVKTQSTSGVSKR